MSESEVIPSDPVTPDLEPQENIMSPKSLVNQYKFQYFKKYQKLKNPNSQKLSSIIFPNLSPKVAKNYKNLKGKIFLDQKSIEVKIN